MACGHSLVSTMLIIAGLTFGWISHAAKTPLEKAKRDTATLETVLGVAAKSDSLKAMDYLQQQGTPQRVAGYYSKLVRYLYFKKKDVPAMILFG